MIGEDQVEIDGLIAVPPFNAKILLSNTTGAISVRRRAVAR